MAQHTAGPWEAKGPSDGKGPYDDGGDFAIYIERDGVDYIIAEAFHRTGKYDFEAAEVNAHLIAASPELLEACKAILLHKMEPVDWDRVFNLAQAAIAKAENHAK